MMVTSSFLSGQQSQKSAPPPVSIAKPTVVTQSGSNGSVVTTKPLFGTTGLASAIAVAAGVRNIGVAKTVSVNLYRYVEHCSCRWYLLLLVKSLRP